MAEFPIMPFHTDAYLGDTTHLTTIEHGAYFLLLLAMWRNGGDLPHDDKMLARFAKVGPRQWQRIKPIIEPFFHEQGGRLSSQKMTATLVAVRQRSRSSSASARARWLKNKGTGYANASNPQCERNAIQTKNQIEEVLPREGVFLEEIEIDAPRGGDGASAPPPSGPSDDLDDLEFLGQEMGGIDTTQRGWNDGDQ